MLFLALLVKFQLSMLSIKFFKPKSLASESFAHVQFFDFAGNVSHKFCFQGEFVRFFFFMTWNWNQGHAKWKMSEKFESVNYALRLRYNFLPLSMRRTSCIVKKSQPMPKKLSAKKFTRGDFFCLPRAFFYKSLIFDQSNWRK